MEKVKNWLIQEKESIVEYQTEAWAQGKQQLAENAEQITHFVEKLVSFVQ
jgi:hypothetical protein